MTFPAGVCAMETCDVCGGPAVVHETLVEGDRVTRRHLCRGHGRPLWRDTADVEIRLKTTPQAALNELRRLPDRSR